MNVYDLIGFIVQHGVLIAGGSAAMFALALLLPFGNAGQRWTAIARRRAPASVPAPAPDGVAAAHVADPVALLRSFARARGAHLLALPDAGVPLDAEVSHTEKGQLVVPFEEFLIAFRHIPRDQPIDILLLHERGMPLPWVRQLAKLLLAHEGKVTVIVPFRAYGPVCLLALAADQIIMSKDAALVFDLENVRHQVAAAFRKGRRHMSDAGLMRHHAIVQYAREVQWLAGILLKHQKVRRWRTFSRRIAQGTYTNGMPARASDLKSMGLNVVTRDVIEKHDIASIEQAGATFFSTSLAHADGGPRVSPTCAEACPAGSVRDAMMSLQARRNTKLICIVHADGTRERFVSNQTIAETLKAIRSTPAGTDLDIILHTPGGDSLGADQIARALKAHKGRKTFFVPYEAYSAGTILSLTGDEIHLSPLAALGPIDTQFGNVPVSRLAYVVEHKPARLIEDALLAAALKARARIREDHLKAVALMKGNYPRGRARRIARTLNDGYLSHSFPIMYEEARKIGLNVRPGVPEEVFTIVDSFLSGRGNFCSVIHCAD